MAGMILGVHNGAVKLAIGAPPFVAQREAPARKHSPMCP